MFTLKRQLNRIYEVACDSTQSNYPINISITNVQKMMQEIMKIYQILISLYEPEQNLNRTRTRTRTGTGTGTGTGTRT